jgi:hypothetical protein
MRIRVALWLAASAGLILGAPAGPASADDPKKPDSPKADAPKADGQVLVFGEGVAHVRVLRDNSAGKITFTLTDPGVTITEAPVLTLSTDDGRKDFTLTAVEGSPGTWVVTDPALRAERLDGTVRIIVAGKTYTSDFVPVAVVGRRLPVAAHGGTVIAFDSCGAFMELVRDESAGSFTLYALDGTRILQPPQVFLMGPKGQVTAVVKPMEGAPGAWVVTNDGLKAAAISGRVRVMINGKPCEASLRGGRILAVENGPSFEVVHDTSGYTFYAVEEQLNGKAYVVENPQVVLTTPAGPKTYTLQRVENEPRAWRLVGLDANVSEPLDGMLRFTLFGKSLETRLGVSGFGVDVR